MSEMLRDPNFCWIDGEFTPSSSTLITSMDPGLSVGLGVFDSLGGYAGKPFELEKHHKRLSHDAAKCGLAAPEYTELQEVLVELMRLNGFSDDRCRLRVSIYALADGVQTVVVNATMVPTRSVLSRVVISPYKVNEFSPLAGVKSTSYAGNSLALREATKEGADEAIMLNTRDHLCEGTTSNLFLLKNGELYTPPLSSGCLPGVTRGTVLEIANELGVIYHTGDLTLDDIYQCEEAFLTSSLREIQSIEQLNGNVLPVVDGEIVQSLREVYQGRAWQ
ncbi:aminotransferase class IV [Rubritalea sp.]|uniref:aminotransferase class IV n=1 Tax=Rubritalea sp. TaxID=2109375 RepID=UPI003EF9F048